MSISPIKPAIVLPMYDPDGLLFPQLETVTPLLKSLFERAIVSVPPSTVTALPDRMIRLLDDAFFSVLYLEQDMPVGLEFKALYRFAAEACQEEQVLHLCYIDRVAYTLQSQYRQPFIDDIKGLLPAQTPLIFERSETAWRTHPDNYVQLEKFVTSVGELLLDCTLDYGWCHLALTPQQLRQALANVSHTKISMVAEMILPLRDDIQMRPVDWLAWEDPFIFGRDPVEMKAEREGSIAETNKRLNYVIPMLELLQATAGNGLEDDGVTG